VTADAPLDQDELITKMVGRELTNLYPEHTSHIGEEVLRVKDWTVHSPSDSSRVIVDHASFYARKGEIVGFAGLMGAGRTEMAMSIFGHNYGSDATGEVDVNGKKINTHTVQGCIDGGLAYATEDRKIYGLNLLRNIRENASVSSLKKISPRGVVDVGQERISVEKYRKGFNIKTPSIDDLVSNLSGGNQQKVLLAKWVISDPDVLILDEPTRGIDVGAKYEIYEIIDQLADAGKTVIFISSELPELIGVCDRIYTVNQGVITNDIPKKDFSQEYLMKWMMEEKPNANMNEMNLEEER
jgi:putative multiple sugar transport system ATP-binding protein